MNNFQRFLSEYQQAFSLTLILYGINVCYYFYILWSHFSKVILTTEEVITATTKVILATEEVIITNLNVISATTNVILASEEVITATLKVISVTTKVILATEEVITTRQTDRQTDILLTEKKSHYRLICHRNERDICTCIYKIVSLLKSYDNIHGMTYTAKIMLSGIAKIKTGYFDNINDYY